MSDDKSQRSTELNDSRVLDELIAEAKTHLDVRDANHANHAAEQDIDWARLESRLMAEIEKEKDKPKPATVTPIRRRRDSVLRGAALVLAVAASVTIYVRRDHAEHERTAGMNESLSQTHAEIISASSLQSTEGAGDVRIDGVAIVTPGYVVHSGDSIDADGARAVFERPGKVAWLLEQDGPADQPHKKGATTTARTRVKSAGESLVLGLEHGVIEAQVVPVPTGEAFAVDIATDHNLVRVAVHGTHLRVAREGNHVSVDLTEGVVSIGVPPRTGVTIGTLVTAPAHVELDATDLATIHVDHDASTVRAAIPLSNHVTMNEAAPTHADPPSLLPATAPATQAPALIANANASNPKPGPASPSKTESSPPKASANLAPRDVIVAGIRDCAAKFSANKKANAADGLDEASRHVMANSSLKLRLTPSGEVELAQFSPPLLPDIQTCAAQVIYKVKFDHVEGGSITIPIEFPVASPTNH